MLSVSEFAETLDNYGMFTYRGGALTCCSTGPPASSRSWEGTPGVVVSQWRLLPGCGVSWVFNKKERPPEVPADTALQSDQPLADRMLELVLHGVSTRVRDGAGSAGRPSGRSKLEVLGRPSRWGRAFWRRWPNGT